MRLTLVLLACVAMAGGLHAASVHKTSVDKEFLAKQKFLLEIVYRVEDPLMFEEWIKLGKELIVDKSVYEKFDKRMEYFYGLYKTGEILPYGEFFSPITSTYHFQQALGLFKFFFHAKDWATLVQNVAWARMHVNPGLFVYALSLAVFHRPDMKGLNLPPIYEIFPQFFYASKYIYRAEKFDYDVWNRQFMLEKELYGINHKNFSGHAYGNYHPVKDFKTWQWYKIIGLGEDFYMEEKNVLRDNIDYYFQFPNYQELFKDVKAFYTPVDYTRDIYYYNDDTQLSYFTEDVGWNAYWYYLNMDYPVYMDYKQSSGSKSRHGEWWFYNVQQMYARYNAERISHGFSELGELSYYGIVETGYDPQLIDYYGNGFTFRKNYFELVSYQNFELANSIANIEHRIMDIIDSGYFVTKDGVKFDLTKPESIEYIGNIVQGNYDSLDSKFFGYWYSFVNAFLSGGDIYDYSLVPHVLMNYETMLRDPISYKLFKTIVDVFYKFYYKFEPYTHEELLFPGVEIYKAEVSKLNTFFDLFDADVTNLLNDKPTFHDGKFIWDKTLLARQVRLNHKPFDFTLYVKANKAQKAVVRSFYVPAVDEYGEKMEVIYKPEMFVQFDQYVYDLVEGENVIKRNSIDFYHSVYDQTTYTELYKYVMFAYEGKAEYTSDFVESYCGFPHRLILPHGWASGMPLKFFFVITPFTGDYVEQESLSCGFNGNSYHYDNLPYGFPFDRKITNYYDFIVPNMYFYDAQVYHIGYYGSHHGLDYSKFGTYDYSH